MTKSCNCGQGVSRSRSGRCFCRLAHLDEQLRRGVALHGDVAALLLHLLKGRLLRARREHLDVLVVAISVRRWVQAERARQRVHHRLRHHTCNLDDRRARDGRLGGRAGVVKARRRLQIRDGATQVAVGRVDQRVQHLSELCQQRRRCRTEGHSRRRQRPHPQPPRSPRGAPLCCPGRASGSETCCIARQAAR